jgi:archaellum component FlaD/FlaE
VDRLIKELLDGVKSRLKKVGEKTGGEVPEAEPLGETQPSITPPEAPKMPADETPSAGEPTVEDFTALLGGEEKDELENKITSLEQKTQKLETTIKQTLDIAKKNSERLDNIDNNMKKFLSLYELVTNQINPFVETTSPIKKMMTVEGETVSEPEEKIVVPPISELEKEAQPLEPEMPLVVEEAEKEAGVIQPVTQPIVQQPVEELKPEEAQAEQVMFMQSIKNGTASFVLEWITSLIGERADLEKNTQLLKYLLNLGWITPKAYDSILKHLEGIIAAGKPLEQKERLEEMIPLTLSIPSTQSSKPQPLKLPVGVGGGEKEEAGDMNQLINVLGWVRYLVNRVGVKDTEEIMRYLVELDWLTPEAHKALLSYIQSSGHTIKAKPPSTEVIQRISEKMGIKPVGATKAPSPTPVPVTQPYGIPEKRFVMPPFEKPKRVGIEEIIPLDSLDDDMDSLAVIVDWVRYFIERAGTGRAKQIFDYYRDIGWISPDVNNVMGEYIDSIKLPEEQAGDYQPTMEDHSTTLFFISRLKKKNLTEEDIRDILS